MLRHPRLPCSLAFEEQNEGWLQEHRDLHTAPGGGVSRTLTRGGRGWVYRWNNKDWIQLAGVPADKAPAKVQASTVKLLDHLKLKTGKIAGTTLFL